MKISSKRRKVFGGGIPKKFRPITSRAATKARRTRSFSSIDHGYEQQYGRWVRSRIQEGYNIRYSGRKTIAQKRLWESKPYSDVWRVVWNLRMSPRLRREARRIWDPKRPVESLLRLLTQMFPLGQGGLIDHLGIGEKRKDYSDALTYPSHDWTPRVEPPVTDEQTPQDTSNTSSSSQRGRYSHRQDSQYSYVRKYRSYLYELLMNDPPSVAIKYIEDLLDSPVYYRGRQQLIPSYPVGKDRFPIQPFNTRDCFHTIYVWKKTKTGWKKTPKRVPCSQKSRRYGRKTRSKYGRRF